MFWKENLQLIMNFEDFDQAYEWFTPRHDLMPFPKMTKAQLRNAVKLFKEDQGPRITYVAEYLDSTSGKDFPTLGDLEQLLRLGRKSMDRTGPEFDDISGTFSVWPMILLSVCVHSCRSIGMMWIGWHRKHQRSQVRTIGR
mgnify:CR=1 FL=1